MRGLCPYRGSARRAGPPEGLAPLRVRGAREDEEQVGEPVQVDERHRVQVAVARDGDYLALDAPADGARDVQARGGLGSPREHEALQRLERLVRLVAVALERVDLRLRHAQLVVCLG